MIRLILFVLSLVIVSLTTASANENDTTWEFTDIDGKHHEPFKDQTTCCLVLIFISTDCPIANSYQPLIQRLTSEHQGDGVRIFLVHSNSTVSIEEARSHARKFSITTPVLLDTDQSIARQVGATTTPQAFAFVQNTKSPVYQGRIDNLYAGYGKKRKVATTHDLADALEAVVAGRAVSNAKTTAVGCFISYTD